MQELNRSCRWVKLDCVGIKLTLGGFGAVWVSAGNWAFCWHSEDEVLNQVVSQLSHALLLPRVNTWGNGYWNNTLCLKKTSALATYTFVLIVHWCPLRLTPAAVIIITLILFFQPPVENLCWEVNYFSSPPCRGKEISISHFDYSKQIVD